MSLDVAKLRTVTNNDIDLRSRFRSLAINVVQKAKDSMSIGSTPWTDDQAKRSRMIEEILSSIPEPEEGDNNNDALVAKVQPSDPVVNKIAEILESGIEAELRKIEPTTQVTVKASNNKN